MGTKHEHFYPEFLLLTIVIIAVTLLLPIIYGAIIKSRSSRCKIELTDQQIFGTKKKHIGATQIQIPLDKLDNVFVNDSLYNKLTGGRTLVISSNSGRIKFPWVQNAQEFADAAVKQMNLVRKSITSAPVQQASAANEDIAAKMEQLKKLKEQGLLSDEEFEQKRRELISRI